MLGTNPQEMRAPVRGMAAADVKSLPLQNVEQCRYPISQPLSPVSQGCATSGSVSPADHTDQQQRITWGLSPEPKEEVDPAPSLQPQDVKKQQASDLNAWHAVQAAVQAVTSSGSARERDINKALARLEPASSPPPDDREGATDAAQARYDRACDVVISPQLQVGGSATVIRGSEALSDGRQTAGTSVSEVPKTSALVGKEPSSNAGVIEKGSSESSPRLPTANELRKGLVELQSLLVDLKDQRRAREEPAVQAEGQAATEEQHGLLQALRLELSEEREEKRNLQEELAYSENSEKHCASLVEELETQICMERGHHASELSSAAVQEAAAVAGLRDEFQSERRAMHEQLTVMKGQEAAALVDSKRLNTECGRLNAELAESSRATPDQSSIADLQSRCKSVSSEAADLASALNAAKAVARHEAAAVGQLRAEQASAMAELRAERDQLILQEEAAASAQVALQTQEARNASAGRFDQSGAARREHQLRTSLAATENQLQMLRNNQKQENTRMEAQADSLERELEHGKLVAAQHWKRSAELEADVQRLTEENKRLHELLVNELTAADSLIRSPLLTTGASRPQDPALVPFADRRARFNGAQDVDNQSQASMVSTPAGPPPNRVPAQRQQGEIAAVAGAVAEDEEADQGSGDAAAGGTQFKRRADSIERPAGSPIQEDGSRSVESSPRKAGLRQPHSEQQMTIQSRPTSLGGSMSFLRKDNAHHPSPASPKAKASAPQQRMAALQRKQSSKPPSQASSVAPTPLAGSPSATPGGTPATRPGISPVRMVQLSSQQQGRYSSGVRLTR